MVQVPGGEVGDIGQRVDAAPHFEGRMARLEHTFTPVEGGTLYENSITLGPDGFAARHVFNSLIRPRVFPDHKAHAWLRHSVEEIGNLQFLLPTLYGRQTDRARDAGQ